MRKSSALDTAVSLTPKSMLFLAIVVAIVVEVSVSSPARSQQQVMPPGHPPVTADASERGYGSSPGDVTGTVIETMDASSYTYVQIDAGNRTVWASAPRFSVKVGDRVSVSTASPMQNYRSDTLGRTFPLVYFAAEIRVANSGTGSAIPTDRATPHPSRSRATPLAEASLSGISKPKGGHTIGEIFDQGKALANNEVVLRGRVVKYSPSIMGTNWLHLQDGTQGKDESNDLVITTDAVAAVGDLVLVRGVITADKDFGFGYQYPLIIEGAKITIE